MGGRRREFLGLVREQMSAAQNARVTDARILDLLHEATMMPLDRVDAVRLPGLAEIVAGWALRTA